MPIIKASNTSEAKGDKPAAAANPSETKSKSWFSWPFGKTATTNEEPPLFEPRKPNPRESKGPVLADANKPKLGDPAPIPIITNKADPESKDRPGVITAVVSAVPARTLTVADLQKSIQAACPKVLSVEVEFTSAKEARITLEIRTDAELSPTAEKVFALPELQNYRLDLQFKISSP